MFQNKISSEVLAKREFPREEDERGAYFRDITAIIHSYPFRRLKHKTQVFFSPKNDHICTRIEHVMHVATISVTICKALGLETELAWAISLAHDLGHTPFGHTGENIVSELNKDNGGFQHEKYSLRVVDSLINYGKGLNLTFGVRDGIINHCGEVFEKYYRSDFKVKDLSLLKARASLPATWEGVVVRASDKIAYLGRDLEDAVLLKIIKKENIPLIVTETLGKTNSEMINTLVKDVIKYAKTENEIGFSDKVYEAMLALKEFNYKNIYRSNTLEEFHQFIERVLKTLWNYLGDIFSKYGYEYDKYKSEKTMLSARFGDYLSKMENFYRDRDEAHGKPHLAVLDYIAGMTDDYALDCVSELYLPGKFFYNFYDYSRLSMRE